MKMDWEEKRRISVCKARMASGNAFLRIPLVFHLSSEGLCGVSRLYRNWPPQAGLQKAPVISLAYIQVVAPAVFPANAHLSW